MNSPIQIVNLRDCSPIIIPCLATWHHQQWSYLNPERSFEQRLEKMQHYLTEDLIPSTWVALDAIGNPLGSAALVAHDMDSFPELGPWLASVYVHPNQRRRGLGAQLVHQVMQAANEGKIETLYLFTPDQAPFYARLGWQAFQETEYRGINVHIMSFSPGSLSS